MDIEKLIERLMSHKGALCELLYKKDMEDAATALSTLQAENEKLRAEVERWKNAHHQAAINYQQENRECNKALAELEKVKVERDAAIEDLSGQCEYCQKKDDCVSRKGPHWNCWQWRGPKKED